MQKPTHLALATIALSTFLALPAAGQTINEDLKLLPSDGAERDWFGYTIDIDNGVVAVVAHRDDDNGDNSGSAYLFDASTGTQLFKLLPSNGVPFGFFGRSIAIDNGVVAVGAISDNNNGFNFTSAYLFDASTGAQLFELLPSDGVLEDQFGNSIAIDNGVVAVGAWHDDDNGDFSGSAYLFDASTGTQLLKLLPSDGTSGNMFGSSIAIDNGVVAVGSRGDDIGSGSAYLFDVSNGKQLFKLLPSDGVEFGNFGYSIAIDNNIVAIGAFGDDNNGTDSGSAYLFDATTGSQLFKLLASDGEAGDLFGFSIAIDNNIVAVGSSDDDDNGSFSGSAYLFDAVTGAQIAKLLPSDGTSHDVFGRSIAIDNGLVAIGAYGDDVIGNNSGSAYVFTTPTPCPADLNNDGTLNFFDVSAFITALAKNDSIADFNNDTRWNFFDVSAFLQAFAAGCP